MIVLESIYMVSMEFHLTVQYFSPIIITLFRNAAGVQLLPCECSALNIQVKNVIVVHYYDSDSEVPSH